MGNNTYIRIIACAVDMLPKLQGAVKNSAGLLCWDINAFFVLQHAAITADLPGLARREAFSPYANAAVMHDHEQASVASIDTHATSLRKILVQWYKYNHEITGKRENLPVRLAGVICDS